MIPQLKLDLVRPRKEGGVAHHGVQQQPLVGIRERRVAELLAEVKVHVDRAHPHARPRHLRLEAQVHALVRLDAEAEEVVVAARRPRLPGKSMCGTALNWIGDLGDLGAAARLPERR